jgi:SagB-type dehydrogenase family enzyme
VNEAPDPRLERHRAFLKDAIRKEIDFRATAQARGLPPPPAQKPCPPDARRVALPPAARLAPLGALPLAEAIARRQSRRQYKDAPLALEELAFLLWATQGVREARGDVVTLRTVPSAGARHAFETYVAVRRVAGLDEGLYRYLPLNHELAFEYAPPSLGPRLAGGTLGQTFVARAAAVFVWTAIPYRMEWRYGLAAHKVLALDAGHVAQNLYLACEAIGAGTCAIAAYDQARMDALVRADGVEEFTVYLAPVGKV